MAVSQPPSEVYEIRLFGPRQVSIAALGCPTELQQRLDVEFAPQGGARQRPQAREAVLPFMHACQERSRTYVSRAIHTCPFTAGALWPRKSANGSVCLICLKNTSIC